MATTLLSTIINRMGRYTTLKSVETQDLVRDLDEALRTLKRKTQLPWALKKSTIRVFKNVLEYPVASDHDELAFLDDPRNPDSYEDRPRFKFTNHQEFIENPDFRNDLAEIWDQGTLYLGIRYSPQGVGEQILNPAELDDNFTASGDASAITEDSVIYKKGNKSIRFTVTNSSGTATVKNTFNSSFVDSNYKKKYHFKWIYLDAVPTSIKLRFQVDDSNYLETTGITTQFSGQALKADAWNLIAHDLSTATEVGTISTSSVWASEKVILVGASTGTYYVDESCIREWTLMDYLYYSKYNVQTVGASVPDQEYFMNTSEVYSTDSSLVGPTEWADVIMLEAMKTGYLDKENEKVWKEVNNKQEDAWEDLYAQYPSMRPMIITTRYRFINDHLLGS